MRQRQQSYSQAAAADRAAGREPDSATSVWSSKVAEEEEPGHPGVSKAHLDFLFKQLRQICYRKVRGNGNDVSIREIFRHFDSEKVRVRGARGGRACGRVAMSVCHVGAAGGMAVAGRRMLGCLRMLQTLHRAGTYGMARRRARRQPSDKF